MLTLQRASAGSGKTYTLTKTYISLLISIIDDATGRRRLRTFAELGDAVSHILAVTFTNKATNEMKERIVSRLYDLAYPKIDPAHPGRRPDYMADFVREFDFDRHLLTDAGEWEKLSRDERETPYTDEEKEALVSRAAREALRQLLYEYSDFNISTIDAFFQNILRTFAYESDLPDAYQVVIDESYIVRLAANALIDDIESGEADKDERHWVNLLVERSRQAGQKSWNIYQRQEGGRFSGGPFRSLIRMAESLDKVEYAGVRDALDDFSASGQTLRHSAGKINTMLLDRATDLFAPLVAAARRVKEEYSAIGAWDYLPQTKNNQKNIDRLLDPEADPLGEHKVQNARNNYSAKAPKALLPQLKALAPLWQELTERFEAWRAYVNDDDDLRYWRVLEKGLPDVALTAALRRRMNDYLTDIDAMKLADTNNMIRRIIADDDVPFIYERLGTTLSHFLIDEFQDTSILQWENFRPLLTESLSHDNANLIIGDAKQSIYRFRNAEPKLITDLVPSQFPDDRIEIRGFSEAENANWRSRPNVVRFNNFFFSMLAAHIDGADLPEVESGRMGKLFANTVQKPNKNITYEDPAGENRTDAEGYVEINYYLPPDKSDTPAETDGDSDDYEKVPPEVVTRIGRLISSLLERGYRQKEIAVLVNSRAAGREVIGGLMAYNMTEHQEPPFQFVSEDSLTLESSSAVTTLIECFRLIQENIEKGLNIRPSGKDTDVSTSEEETPGFGSIGERRINWVDVQNQFRIFSADHPGMDLQMRLSEFFSGKTGGEKLVRTIADMQAVTLPSLVEELTKAFVMAPTRRREAPFLAAFQDAVLDYCEVHPTDIGSMLRWWDSTGRNISISSPEDTDAINVMTIHKSKGLEFECVILPDINLKFGVDKVSLWAEVPAGKVSYASLLPRMMPVTLTAKNVADTVWQPLLDEERFLVQMDNINKIYVAMTRAVSELYLFLPTPLDKEGRVNTREENRLSGESLRICGEEEAPDAPEIRRIEVDDSQTAGFTYGEPVADVARALAKDRRSHDRREKPVILDDYFVNPERDILRYHPDGVPGFLDEADDDRADPRSEGSLKHAVLELVEKEGDLQHALGKLRGRGVLTRKVIRQYEPELRAALESVREYGWFDGSSKVLTERSMICRDIPVKRPDRVMVDAEGNATVVDYKFGDTPKDKLYSHQVGQYMGYLEAMGKFAGVRGYVWYVKLNRVLEVTESVSVAQSVKEWKQKLAERRERIEKREGAMTVGDTGGGIEV
ncbi:MAG: UvrD-helicase domain-containing protein [Muribaculaceae bacterium]|nr:UvrD-helicase domain-containing protein [Muribaculaceae bacterium]